MQIIEPGTTIDFLSRRKTAAAISATVIAVSLISLAVRGLNFGIDFRGGTLVQISFDADTTIDAVHDGIDELDLGESNVQNFENSAREYLIRIDDGGSAAAVPDDEESVEGQTFSEERIKSALAAQFGGIQIDRVEMVGPKVGGELKRKGLLSVVWALGFVLLYISVRFQLRYGVGAIAALVHDVIVTLGIFSITGLEVQLPIVAAVLTIVGYSLNDTIVVYDRIRENLARRRKAKLEDVVNQSLNETLSRTLLTSITTLLVVTILVLFGGGVIFPFALALLIGVLVGTYSSIFVASPTLLVWEERFGEPTPASSSAS